MALVVLAIIWAAVLIPPLVRQRAEVRPADSIGDFRRRLGVLQRTSPVSVEPAFRLQSPYVGAMAAANNAMSRSHRIDQRRRRRDILVGLTATAAGTLFVGLLPAFRVLLWVHLIADVLLLAYVSVLVQLRKRAEERRQKLRYLPTGGLAPVALLAPASEDSAVTVIAQSQ